MSEPREIELKLEVPIDSLPRLARSSVLKGAAASGPRPSNLVSVYFDTKKLKLRQSGFTLRLRRSGRRLVQTVKQENGPSGTLLTRGEWEHDVSTRQPDLDAARDTGLAPLLTKKLRRRLQPVFETSVRRKVFQIRSGDSRIELSLDKGKVEAGRKSSPICEVELELKQGEPADLFEIARALAQEVPVQLTAQSKPDRGYALLASAKPAAVKAPPVAPRPDADVRSAFQAIAKTCLHHLVANQSVTLEGDPEGLHQMRVALRRMRAAISLFSDMLADPQTSAMKAEFKWIAGELGPARELDIFFKSVVKPLADRKPPANGVAPLSRELRKRRRDAFARAHAAIDSTRFRVLTLDAAAWVEAGDWLHNPDDMAGLLRERPIADAGAEELQRRWKKIRKRGKHLRELDTQKRHRLRIQAKKLRYAAEFFQSVFTGKKSKRRWHHFLTGLEALQDALGALNDIGVHEKLSQQLVDGEDARLQRRGGRADKAFVAGRLSGREEARAAPVLEDATRAYAKFAKAKPFWT